MFNIGSGRQYTVAETVSLIEKLLNKKLNVQYYQRKSLSKDYEHLIADAQKAQRFLGWKACHSFEAGLKKTIKWVQKNINLYKKNGS